MRANFEPEVTNEDLEREERELAEQEEAAAVATFSFPAVPPRSPVEPPAEPEPEAPSNPEPEPEEEEEVAPASSVADDQTFITDDTLATETSSPTLPRTPLSPPPLTPSSQPPSTPAATSTPQSHADRIKKAAKEQRRRMREEAARIKKEAIERRAEAAAGGFGFEEPQVEAQHPQEFGEFVVGQHGGVGVAWTESDGASSHPPPRYQQHFQPPLPAMHIPAAPFHHQLHPDEHPLSPSDDELMDYGAEYAASRRPRKSTALMGVDSASGSDRLERMSNGSGTSRVRAHLVPLPASTYGSPRKPTVLHRATGSGTLSNHSGLSGQGGQVYYQPVAPVQFQGPVHAERVEFDGVPGGLDDPQPPPSAGFAHQGEYVLAPADYAPQVQPYQEFDGIPGGLSSHHTRSRAGSVMDLGTPAKKPPMPQRSHTSSIDSVGMGMGTGGFPSTGFGSSIGAAGRPRAGSRARMLDSGAAAAMLGRTVE
ncbi:hypothetical protein FS837_007004 [Tulasnella sp. UAMH 9824]|nr:hypothetical protein FS837_007004 [Tulasnella sp. UAMH 9824]